MKTPRLVSVSRAIHLLAGFLVMFTILPNVAPAEEKPLATASPAQLQDEAYTKKIREYTTEPFFLTDAWVELRSESS